MDCDAALPGEKLQAKAYWHGKRNTFSLQRIEIVTNGASLAEEAFRVVGDECKALGLPPPHVTKGQIPEFGPDN